MRVSHITAAEKYGEKGRPIVYKDETHIHRSPTGPKNFSEGSALDMLAHVSRGE
jgi:hypothetical protein